MFKNIRQENGVWLVPSETSPSKTYAVHLDEPSTCECDDFEKYPQACKHIWAARIVQSGTSLKFANSIMRRAKRPPLDRDWVLYRQAQENEHEDFLVLARDLCSGLETPIMGPKGGRPSLSLSDAIFGLLVKTYEPKGAQRTKGRLKVLLRSGFIHELPSSNTLLNYLNSPKITAVLQRLITLSTLPLRALETTFAVDSTGFSTLNFNYGTDEKSGVELGIREYVKAHVVCGVKTHVITAIDVSSGNCNDAPFLPELVRRTAQNFAVREVCGDKAYPTDENIKAVADVGGQPYLMFKRNHTGGIGGLFEKYFHEFSLNREEFNRKYHARSNVESAFSMVKRVFGERLFSKKETAIHNEVLCKFICHNIRCLIKCRYEMGSTISLAPHASRIPAKPENFGGLFAQPNSAIGLRATRLDDAEPFKEPKMGNCHSELVRVSKWMAGLGWLLVPVDGGTHGRKRRPSPDDRCAFCQNRISPNDQRFQKSCLANRIGDCQQTEFACVKCAVDEFAIAFPDETGRDRIGTTHSSTPPSGPPQMIPAYCFSFHKPVT